MRSKIIAGLAVIILAGLSIALAASHNSKSASRTVTPSRQPADQSSQAAATATPTSLPTSTPTPVATQAAPVPAPAAATPAPVVNISLSANDSGASRTSITISKGSRVNLTFMVDTQGTYYGGLYFKSTDPAVASAGPIKPGSQATVSFTAANSFSFIPYWYDENVQKGYSIAINVQ